MAKGMKHQGKGNKWLEATKVVLECIENNEKKYGKKSLIQILLASKRDKNRFQKNKYWGALSNKIQFKELIYLFDFLEGEEFIGQGLKKGYVYLKDKGKKFLENSDEIQVNWEILKFYRLPYDYGLINHLRVVRRDISNKMGVEPYRICSDAMLERLAILRPKNLGFLYKEAKELIRYMPESIWLKFLQAIHNYEMEKYWNSIEKTLEKTKHYSVKELIEQDKNLEEIERKLNLKRYTILKYIEDLSALGKINPMEWLKNRGLITQEVEKAAKYIHYTGIRSRRYITQSFHLTYEQFWASRILSHLLPIS